MTTTASERTTVTTSRRKQRFGMNRGMLGMIRRPARVHVNALLKRDAYGRHFHD
jgi:hypothetical protein